MQLQLVDTHAHLDFAAYDADRDAVLERAREAGVRAIVDVALAPDAAEPVLALADRYPEVYAAVGIHPHHAAAVAEGLERALQQLERLATHPRVVALGEAGIDLYRPSAPEPVQRTVFEAQLELAAGLGLPVIVHQRQAEQQVLDVLATWRPRLRTVILHCFTGGPELARRCAELDVYFGLGGVLTFPSARGLRAAARGAIPPERMLLETDAPFLAPQARRGQRNEPAYVRFVAEALAACLEAPVEEVARLTWANARRALPRLAGDG